MFVNPISYPGNKNKLLKQLISEFPSDISIFVDVFCGSGVVGANSNANTVICNDICEACTDILKFFYDKPFDEIMSKLEEVINYYHLSYSHRDGKTYIEQKHEGLSRVNKEQYNQLKHDYNLHPSIEKLIILSIYGFNHYIRFNKKGFFNVPVGKVDLSSSIFKNLKQFINHIKSKNLVFKNNDFRDASLYVHQDAIYYFDPPYLITTAPYNLAWNEKDEEDLLNLLDRLDRENKKFCLSNVFLSNGKENKKLIEWSKKYKTVLMRRQYRNANYQKINITDTIEVVVKNF